jgi:hypothetical protein
MTLDHKAIVHQIDSILARNAKAFASTDDVIAFHAVMSQPFAGWLLPVVRILKA